MVYLLTYSPSSSTLRAGDTYSSSTYTSARLRKASECSSRLRSSSARPGSIVTLKARYTASLTVALMRMSPAPLKLTG